VEGGEIGDGLVVILVFGDGLVVILVVGDGLVVILVVGDGLAVGLAVGLAITSAAIIINMAVCNRGNHICKVKGI